VYLPYSTVAQTGTTRTQAMKYLVFVINTDYDILTFMKKSSALAVSENNLTYQRTRVSGVILLIKVYFTSDAQQSHFICSTMKGIKF